MSWIYITWGLRPPRVSANNVIYGRDLGHTASFPSLEKLERLSNYGQSHFHSSITDSPKINPGHQSLCEAPLVGHVLYVLSHVIAGRIK